MYSSAFDAHIPDRMDALSCIHSVPRIDADKTKRIHLSIDNMLRNDASHMCTHIAPLFMMKTFATIVQHVSRQQRKKTTKKNET